MLRSRTRRILLAMLVVAAVLVGALAVNRTLGIGVQATSAQAADPGPYHAQDIVDGYLGILNTGMASGNCDFSALATVYAPDATVRATGGPFAPGGPFGPGGAFGQQEFDGLDAITGFYTKLCHIVSGRGVAQWTQDAGFLLSPNVLDSYEHVSFSGVLGGHCEHVFTISGDQIASLDWSVYA